tara:strand:+ start:45 stop:1610 length:1566 start_codon:yes stop_codon:yes gene_type:complete
MSPFKNTELKSDWRSDFITEQTECDCEGCGQDPCIKCGESHHNINEELQGGVSVETYTKDTKFTEIETIDIIKAKPLVSEGNRTKALTNQGKKTVDPKKNELISASYEAEEGTDILVEDFMTDLYNEGCTVDEINEYLLEEYEIDEEYLEEVWGILAKGALKGAKLLSKGAGYAAKRAAKDSGKVIKAVKNPANLRRANLDTQKVIDTVAKGAKDTKELAARTYAAGQKTRKFVDAGGKNLLGPAKSFKKLTSDFKKSQKAATRAINIEKIRATAPVVPKVKAPTNVGKVNLPKTGSQTATKTKVEPKLTKVKSPVSKTQYKEPITPKYSRSQKSALTGKANKVIAQIRGNTPGAKVSARMEKGYNKSLEKTGDKIIKDIKATPIPKNKAIVKSPGGKMTPSPSGSLAKTTDKGSAMVPSPGGKVTKEVGANTRKLSVKDKLNKAASGTKGAGTMQASSKEPFKGVKQLSPSKKDNVKNAVAATSFAAGSLGGVEVSKKLGLLKNKDKKESFSNWRSEINL